MKPRADVSVEFCVPESVSVPESLSTMYEPPVLTMLMLPAQVLLPERFLSWYAVALLVRPFNRRA